MIRMSMIYVGLTIPMSLGPNGRVWHLKSIGRRLFINFVSDIRHMNIAGFIAKNPLIWVMVLRSRLWGIVQWMKGSAIWLFNIIRALCNPKNFPMSKRARWPNNSDFIIWNKIRIIMRRQKLLPFLKMPRGAVRLWPITFWAFYLTRAIWA